MALTREQVLDLLGILAVTAGTAAGFAIGGPIGSGVIAAIGLNLSSRIIGRGGSKLKQRWGSSDDGVLNHDIQNALARAFEKALASIEDKYFNLQAGALPKEEKKYIGQLFRQLKKQATSGFLAALRQATQEQAIKDYLYEAEEETVKGKLWQQIEQANALPDENEDFKKFLRDNLFVELQFWFGEELKTDNRESNKAWRAFQRLLLEGIQAEVEAVRASQTAIQQDLQKLASLEERLEQLREVIDRRSPDEPFQQGLEKAVDQVRSRLEELYRIAQRTEEKVDAANTKLDFIIDTLDGPRVERHAAFANTAPPMPPNFVPRREELDALHRVVIGDRNTGPVALTGLRGMGGIGKTALAIALCHDGGVQEIFSDGVVWVDIGREPGNLAGKMRRVGQALGDGPGYYDTPEAGIDRLRLLLKDKAVLLVLDDVWDARHVEPFLANAPRCRMLFTTRNADIALRLNAREVPLGVLEPEQAVALLREWATRDDPALPDIAERLGYLPLALRLAGTQLRRERESGAEWLKTFKRLSQLKLGYYSTDPQENLQVCFDLSVHWLPPEHQQLYYALGIFREDVPIPQSVIARLWRQLSPELSQFDCDELVTELGQLALIERNAANETVTLHDLLREYTREQLGEDQLAATHAALLNAYNLEGKPWPQIEHDGYLYYHLAYHLRAAGREEELYALLIGSPDWMNAKFTACTGDTAYVADLDSAIDDFADPLAAPEVLISVKLYMARQVVNARVSSYTNTDLETLVWLEREKEALAHARLRGMAGDKFNGLLIVYSTLREKDQPNLPLLSEAREVARSIEHGWWRSEALSFLAATLAQAERYDEAREVAGNIEGDKERGKVLSFLAGALAQAGDDNRSRELFDEAREVAGNIKDDWKRLGALSFLAGTLARAGRYDEAIQVVRSIIEDDSDSWWLTEVQWKVASALAEAHVREERYDEAIQVARIIADDSLRSKTLSSLAAGLARAGDDDRSRELFDEAKEVAIEVSSGAIGSLLEDTGRKLTNRKLSGVFGDAIVLRSESILAQRLDATGRYDEAKEVARSINEEDWWGLEAKSTPLSSLAEALARAERYDEAREVVGNLTDNGERGTALSILAIALARAERYDEAKEIVGSIIVDSERSEALRGLVVALARAERYEEAKEVARSIEDDRWQSKALSSLAGALARAGDERQARELFDEAREVAGSIEYGRVASSEALRDLVAALAQVGRYEEAKEAAGNIKDEWKRSEALSSLVASLAREGRYDEAKEIACNMEDDKARLEALGSVVPALVQAGRYDEVIEVADNLKGDWERSQTLSFLAAGLARAGDDDRSREQFDEAKEVVGNIKDDEKRSRALSSLVASLARAERYDEARNVARSIEDDGLRLETLLDLEKAVARAGDDNRSRELLDEVKEVARNLKDDRDQSKVLRDLARALAQAGRYDEAKEIVGSIIVDSERSEALRGLVVALARAERYEEAKEVARSIEDDTDHIALFFWLRARTRSEALKDLAGALARAGRYDEAKEAAGNIEDEWKRSEALSSLVASLAREGRYDEAVEVVRSIRVGSERSEALRGLVVALAQVGRYEEAKEVARSIEDDRWQSKALSSLAGALARAGDERQARELFDEAREVAGSIEDDRVASSEALRDLVIALARAERYEEAKEVAGNIEDEWKRSEALSSLVASLAREGRYDEAVEVVRSIRVGSERSEALRGLAVALVRAGRYEEAREVADNLKVGGWFQLVSELKALEDVASALAQAGRFNYALNVLGLRTLDEFLQALAVWAPSFEQVTPGLSVDVLREATGMAGWVRSDWREIHELLNF